MTSVSNLMYNSSQNIVNTINLQQVYFLRSDSFSKIGFCLSSNNVDDKAKVPVELDIIWQQVKLLEEIVERTNVMLQ